MVAPYRCIFVMMASVIVGVSKVDSARGSFYLSRCSVASKNNGRPLGGDLNSETRSDHVQKPLRSWKHSTYGACSFAERASGSGTQNCLTERDRHAATRGPSW